MYEVKISQATGYTLTLISNGFINNVRESVAAHTMKTISSYPLASTNTTTITLYFAPRYIVCIIKVTGKDLHGRYGNTGARIMPRVESES